MKRILNDLVNKLKDIDENETVEEFKGFEGYGKNRREYNYVNGWSVKGVLKRFVEKKSGIRTQDRIENLKNYIQAYEQKQQIKNKIFEELKEAIYNKEPQEVIENLRLKANENHILKEFENKFKEIEKQIKKDKIKYIKQAQKEIKQLINGEIENIDLSKYNDFIKEIYLNVLLQQEANEDQTVVITFNNGKSLGLSSYDTQSRNVFKRFIEGKMYEDKGEIKYSTDDEDYNLTLSDVVEIKILNADERTELGKKLNSYKNKGGSFMIYKIKEIQDIINEFKADKNIKFEEKDIENLIKMLLKKYQLSNDLSDDIFKINCLNYSIIQYQEYNSKITDDLIMKLKSSCILRHIDSKFLEEVSKKFKLNFNVLDYKNDRKKYTIKNGAVDINLVVYNGHFFINEVIKSIKYKGKSISSAYFVSRVITDKRFTYQELLNLPSCLDYAKDIELSREKDFYNGMIKYYTSEKSEKKKTDKPTMLIYADTEATVCESYEQLKNDRENYKNIKDYKAFEQKAYCISYTECKFKNPKVDKDAYNMISYYGFDCLNKFMDDMAELAENYEVIIYFHNLGYDFNMFNKFNYYSCVSKGRKIYSGSILYKGKIIKFKDSLAILSMSIKACANEYCKGYNLQKEMFPYKYYNTNNIGKIGIYEDIDIDEEYQFDLEIFKSNCKKIGAELNEKEFDMGMYCKFYCEQDVRILATSFDIFRENTLKELNKDIINYTTIPGLAKELISEQVLNDKNISLISGELQEFIRKSLYGGRTMTTQNKSWLCYFKIASMDYCSLYPSAMSELYTINGKPEIMTREELEDNNYLNLTCAFKSQPDENKYISGYVVEIVITKINRFKKFKVLTFKTDKGSQYLDKDVKLPRKVVVNNITLEDYIKNHDIEFFTLQGVKYTGTKDFESIKNFIQKLFNTRAKLKKEKKSSQIIYKLLLNSAYGKLIQKPIETEIKFVNKKKRLNANQLTKLFRNKYNIKSFSLKNWLNMEENKHYKIYFNKALSGFKKGLKPEDYKMLLSEDYETINRKDFIKRFKEIRGIKEYDGLSKFLTKNPKFNEYFKDGLINDKLSDEKLYEIFDDIYYDGISRYICKNEYKIKDMTEISKDLTRIDVYKSQLNQFSDPWLGSLILAYSKRLMNNVFEIIEELEERDKYKLIYDMALNEMIAINEKNIDKTLYKQLFNDGRENNVIAFYQDTDSIYLRYKYLQEINEKFKAKYGFELLKANTLSRMHSPDFEANEMNIIKNPELFVEGNILADKSIFLTKKLYYCKLYESKSDNYGDHIRSKGIPLKALKYKVEKDYNGDYYKLYFDLLKGKKIQIDLLKTCANIKQNKDFKITSLNEFFRTMKLENINVNLLKYEDESKPKEPITSFKVRNLTDKDLIGHYWKEESFYSNFNECFRYTMLNNFKKFPMYSDEHHTMINLNVINHIYTLTEFKKLKQQNKIDLSKPYLISNVKKDYTPILGKRFGFILADPELFKIIVKDTWIYIPYKDKTYQITGRGRQLKYDNVIVIDFDVKNPDYKQELINIYKNFNVGKLITSPNDGLHIELQHDKIFYNDELKGRFRTCFKSENYNIDLFMPNTSYSICVCEGSYVYSKQGDIRTYKVIQDNEDKSFSSFIHKFNLLNNKKSFLVNWKSEYLNDDEKKSIKNNNNYLYSSELKSSFDWGKCGYLDDIDYFPLFETDIHYKEVETEKDEDGNIIRCSNSLVCYHLGKFTREAKKLILEKLLNEDYASGKSKVELAKVLNNELY